MDDRDVSSPSLSASQRVGDVSGVRAPTVSVAVAVATDPVVVFSSAAAAVADDTACSRGSYLRLQAQLREERTAFLKELLHARQTTSRLERQLAALQLQVTSGVSSPRLLQRAPSSSAATAAIPPAPSHESAAASPLALDAIVKAVNDADAVAAVADAASLARAQLEVAHQAELAKVRAAGSNREAELQDKLRESEYGRRVEGETAAIRRKRTLHDVERAVAKRTEALQRNGESLQRRVDELTSKLHAVEAELADRSAQAGQQSLVISRLQQQLSEGAHERTEMRAALDVVAGQSAQLIAMQKGEYVAAPPPPSSSSANGAAVGHYHIARRRSSSIGAAAPAALDRSVTPPRALYARGNGTNPLAIVADDPLTPAPPAPQSNGGGGVLSPQVHQQRRSLSHRPPSIDKPTSPTDRRPPQFGERRSTAGESSRPHMSPKLAEDPLAFPPPEVASDL